MVSVVYLTTVDLDDNSAQSRQIQCMSDAFFKGVESFTLVGFAGAVNHRVYPVRLWNSKRYRKKIIRTMLLCYYAVKKWLVSKPSLIFTRDMYVALIFSGIGFTVVWECHQRIGGFARFMLRYGRRRSNFYLLVISKQLLESGGLPPFSVSRSFVYHDCVSLGLKPKQTDVSKIDAFRAMYGSKVAVYTGALHKGKDVDSLEPLFDVFKDWSFVIVGGQEPHLSEYREKFGKFKNVYLTGFVSHDEAVFFQQSGDLLLYPLTKTNHLWRWTSPLKLFEYMLTGNPILASSIGSVKEIINNENAFCYKGEDVVSAFRAFLAADAMAIKKMSENNFSLLRDVYNWDSRVKYILRAASVA